MKGNQREFRQYPQTKRCQRAQKAAWSEGAGIALDEVILMNHRFDRNPAIRLQTLTQKDDFIC